MLLQISSKPSSIDWLDKWLDTICMYLFIGDLRGDWRWLGSFATFSCMVYWPPSALWGIFATSHPDIVITFRDQSFWIQRVTEMREFVYGHSTLLSKLLKEVFRLARNCFYSLNKVFTEVVGLQLLCTTPTCPVLDVWHIASGTAWALRKFDLCFLSCLLESGELGRSPNEMLSIQILHFDYFFRDDIMNHCVHHLIKVRSMHKA